MSDVNLVRDAFFACVGWKFNGIKKNFLDLTINWGIFTLKFYKLNYFAKKWFWIHPFRGK